ncbi:HEPN domain-containing protein [Delftia sp. NA_296.1]|uniref:HEPN domain-containing protein n=1 Tax=Delftia sp. NA_296.1 TaxID=3415648 RepID=UPI00404667BA
MSSSAYSKFGSIIERADLLTTQAGKHRKKTEQQTKLTILHAGLAYQVAAWDAYIKAVSTEYFSVTASPTDPRFSSVHNILQNQLTIALNKFNTPNSNNSRDLFMKYMDFDPWPNWTNMKFNGVTLTASLLVRERLDEILKIRHSFAHGFNIPSYTWNTDSNGNATLNCDILKNTRKLITEICGETDKALSTHISHQHGIPNPW